MRIQCPSCCHEIEFEMDIRIKNTGCMFCSLTPEEKGLIVGLVACRGNISEFMARIGTSREIINRNLEDLTKKFSDYTASRDLLPGNRILDDTLISELIASMGLVVFTTYPDFIGYLDSNYPGLIARYVGESPRNWRARIGRRLSAYAQDTGRIAKAGRRGNSQIWEVVHG